jgi:hypothetical protein
LIELGATVSYGTHPCGFRVKKTTEGLPRPRLYLSANNLMPGIRADHLAQSGIHRQGKRAQYNGAVRANPIRPCWASVDKSG